MGTDNRQFRRRFRVWRIKVRERSSDFSLRSTELGWLSRVGPRLKIEVLVEGNTWTLKSRIFVEDSSGSSGRPWVSGLRDSKKFIFAQRCRNFLLLWLFLLKGHSMVVWFSPSRGAGLRGGHLALFLPILGIV